MLHVYWRESTTPFLRWLATPQKLIKQSQEPETTASCLCSLSWQPQHFRKHFRRFGPQATFNPKREKSAMATGNSEDVLLGHIHNPWNTTSFIVENLIRATHRIKIDGVLWEKGKAGKGLYTKLTIPKRKGLSSNHYFSGAILNFGGYTPYVFKLVMSSLWPPSAHLEICLHCLTLLRVSYRNDALCSCEEGMYSQVVFTTPFGSLAMFNYLKVELGCMAMGSRGKKQGGFGTLV